MKNFQGIPIFIGYDSRERAATNVLIDSLYQNSSIPIACIPLVTSQLIKQGIFWREKDPKQSTEFSFTRFLIPYLMNYQGWAIFMDCDMLCNSDIKELWDQRDEDFSLMCVKHDHKPKETRKFLGEIQSPYPKKNWSSLMLINSSKCSNLTLDFVNSASGLDLHRFNWLENDSQIGSIKGNWNFLVDVQEQDNLDFKKDIKLAHWTLGGPWFRDCRMNSTNLATEWFTARDDSIRLWD